MTALEHRTARVLPERARPAAAKRALLPWLLPLLLSTLACACAVLTRHQGFYIPRANSVFYQLAVKAGTDKVTQTATSGVYGHAYDAIYTKYFEGNARNIVSRLLEVGLGCTMEYGPGASSKLWRWYFPQAEIWQAEYNKECVDKHRSKLDELDIKVLTGDQSDTHTLHSWIRESGGRFDVIIDDGGHSNMQQYSSFLVLFLHALKPGGVYFMEDLQCTRWLVDGDKQHIMQDVIKDWMDALTHELGAGGDSVKYVPKHTLPPRIKFIECGAGICAFTKCYHDDEACKFPTITADESLRNYKFKGTDAQYMG